MAFDCFLNIEGVPGESTDEAHAEWIEVLSYSHGLSQPSSGSVSSGGARSAERCQHEDLSITHTLDKASPKLALFCCNGTHIGEVKLALCRATGEKTQYMEYCMNDVLVSGVMPHGQASQEGSALPLEDVSFNYGKIKWTYTETDHNTGSPKGNVETWWSPSTNTGG